ncbi:MULTISPECIES: hypothetical protein [Anaerococcus]|uniref:hypothetical protein n=1 Tax=Anaerococcus TaxID=165779 RepID=UPI001AE9A48D|nr:MULTISPECIES: hypothetical protein [Anaerococcus]MBP2069863.1 signal transduction histidine kinase [Anaerococcus nagyae]MDU1827905.1 hypothetical protein [Anaerococcus sp.]MDU1863763.1 hypothetical protein [Anaerococcus sp.]MDU2353397.1 hypothetical protein [Anaerococcus sp.]MDU2565703.1 hypothetical protein [Anaerococcus sp.]
MSDNKKFFYNEAKVLIIILLSILGFLFVKKANFLAFAIITSIVFYLAIIFIESNNLKFSKHILNIILAFYNVISLLFMVQYFISGIDEVKIYEIFLHPFINDGVYKIEYIVWIFIYTLFLLIIQSSKLEFSGENYGR